MKFNNNYPVLASYAMYRALYESGKYKSAYYILADYIKMSIVTHAVFVFNTFEMRSYLLDDYGFDLPIAVVENAIKKITDVQYSDGLYKLSKDIGNDLKEFTAYHDHASEDERYIKLKLDEFIARGKLVDNTQRDNIMDSLVAYLIDEECQYSELISEFICLNQTDQKLITILDSIRSGGILYMGLAYNITETGGIKNPICVFLDTEILFDILGYNGIVYKELADDMLSMCKEGNNGKRKGMISLKYFTETRDEIERYFSAAEDIVYYKKSYEPLKPAMQKIINGCKTVADVRDKCSDFFTVLREDYSITLDDKTNYYDPELYKYYLSDDICQQDVYADARENFELIQHINLRRRGQSFKDYMLCGSLFVTDTQKTISLSKEIVSTNLGVDANYVQYAIRLNHFTNILWYKLNKGFGAKCFPANIQTLLKAKSILANSIIQHIDKQYAKDKEDYKKGTLSETAYISRILMYKHKSIFPEDISNITYEELNDFSEANLDKFLIERDKHEEQIAQLEFTIKDSEKKYSHEIEKRDKDLSEARTIISNKENEIKILNEQYLAAKDELDQRSANMNKFKNVIKIFIFIFAIMVITFGLHCIFESDIISCASLVISCLSPVASKKIKV